MKIQIAAKISREELHALDDHALGAACFEPLILAYKELQTRGEDFISLVYAGLSKGQQSLFVFWTYYSHVQQSPSEFYWWSAYNLAQPKRWSAILNSLRFFGDEVTLAVVKEMENLLRERNHPRSLERFDVSFDDIVRDPALGEATATLYNRLLISLSATLQLVSRHIRTNQHDFFVFV